MTKNILSYYEITPEAIIQPYGSGLINTTLKISDQLQSYILQKINQEVFKEPQHIASNIQTIASYLQKNHPEYFFVSPVKTKNGESMVYLPGEGYFRLFPFVKNSHSYNVVQTPQQAFEAARQFSMFTKILSGLPAESLKTTLPDFHNLTYRYKQFEHALQHGNHLRIKETKKSIDFLHSHDHIVSTYQKIVSGKEFKLRVTHHDTKISNVLFDEKGKGICVIDLDTVMPGYFISDVGDMMRTYLSPVSEEEKNFSKIEVREDYFKAILQGYLEQMGTELTAEELRHFVYGGMFMTYMQAIRFLTDYLNNDSYYGASYEGHNYIRAKNQISLLERLLEKESKLNDMVFEIVRKQ
ncbi:MAG: aminoglycoside phosphotransferase family protein [Bacteroidota bacterium]|nr:aminoglycoside phosphotransferase family protein [Bacteroidota bacterium]